MRWRIGHHMAQPPRRRNRVRALGRVAGGPIIAGAGMAAHLPGVVAAHTTLPVIGVPLYQDALAGADALYSCVQMPPGVPVATVAIGGAKNAAVLAVQMLALGDKSLAEKLRAFKRELAEGLKL